MADSDDGTHLANRLVAMRNAEVKRVELLTHSGLIHCSMWGVGKSYAEYKLAIPVEPDAAATLRAGDTITITVRAVAR